MKRLGLVLAFVAGAAFGQGKPASGSSANGVTTDTVQTITGAKTFSATLTAGTIAATTVGATTGNITTVVATTVGATTGNITTVNATTVASATVSATGLISSTVASGSSALTILQGAKLTLASGVTLSSDGTLILASHVLAPASGGTNLGTSSKYWGTIFLDQWMDGASNARIYMPNTGNQYTESTSAPDGSSVAHMFKTKNTYSAGSLVRFQNVGTAKLDVDYDGSLLQSRITLRTCAAGIEGMISMDVAGGASTGSATKVCLCRSNGSATYTWINLVTGTNGTTTTCAN